MKKYPKIRSNAKHRLERWERMFTSYAHMHGTHFNDKAIFSQLLNAATCRRNRKANRMKWRVLSLFAKLM